MKDEALKLALEALEQLDGIDTETECVTIDVGDVIDAIKEALSQPEQEPVAWEQFYPDIGKLQLTHPPQGIYYTPPQRKPLLDEFGCWWFEYGSGLFPLEGEDQEEHAYRVATAAWQAAHGIKGD